jgi:pimeloyl-ACP methyl ester carboxylesterase
MWKTDLRGRTERHETLARSLNDLRARIAGLNCPTLVVRGGDSKILREEDARRFAEAIPNGRWLAIAGAGHSVQGDQPKALIEVLRGFLDELQVRGSGRDAN